MLAAARAVRPAAAARGRPSSAAALDRYAGAPVAELLTGTACRIGGGQELAADLADRTARVRELAREADLLRHGLAEIAAVTPETGEDVALAAEASGWRTRTSRRLAARGAHDALAGDPADPAAADADVTALLGAARLALAHESAVILKLGALGKRLDEVAYLVADVAAELASYAERADAADPARLAEVEDRRAALKAPVRKQHAESVRRKNRWSWWPGSALRHRRSRRRRRAPAGDRPGRPADRRPARPRRSRHG